MTQDEADRGPTFARRQLGRALKTLRGQAGLTLAEAAEFAAISPATVVRLESGKTSCSPLVAKALAEGYGADPARLAALTELAKTTKNPSWFSPFSSVIPESLRPYFGLESSASALSWYESELVPALLQTEAYARALVRHGFPDAPDDEIEQRVKLRLARQTLLTRPIGAPTLRVVLNEAVVLRPVGGPEVLKEQRRHLFRVAQLPCITVRVLPFDVGAHPGQWFGSFVLLDFAALDDGVASEPAIVYVESPTGGLFLDKAAVTVQYRDAFQRMWDAAEPLAAGKTREWE